MTWKKTLDPDQKGWFKKRFRNFPLIKLPNFRDVIDIGNNISLFENISRLDRFELIAKLNQFLINVNDSEATEKMRNLLRKAVLEEILKNSETIDRQFYALRLHQVIDQLNLDSEIPGYPCVFIGCRYQADRHRSFVVHIKRCHPNIKHVKCNFKKRCDQTFPGVDELVNHIKALHSDTEATVAPHLIASSGLVDEINVPCKCNQLSCNGVQFPSVKKLMSHWNSFHSSENRECIFLGCTTTFSTQKVGQNHFRLQHKHMKKLTLKNRHLVEPIASASGECSTAVDMPGPQPAENLEEQRRFDLGDDNYGEADFDIIENSDNAIETESEKQSSEEFYMFYYSDFLNRLTNFKFIPQATVTEIAEEYLSNTRKSLKSREVLLRKSLQSLPQISESDIEKVVREVLVNDKFLTAQTNLNSEFKRTKFVQEKMQYVSPVEIVLNEDEVRRGEKKDIYHYVPLTHSIKVLLEDPSLNKMLALNAGKSKYDGKIYDVKDGTAYRENVFFKENPDAFSILLYSDAVELKGSRQN